MLCLTSPLSLIPMLWFTALATEKIIQKPYNLTAMQGQRVTLHCIIELAEKGRIYAVPWYKVLSSGKRKEICLPDPTQKFQRGQDNTSLVISAVDIEDSGSYICQLRTLSVKQEGNGTQLIVLVPPSVPLLFLNMPPTQASVQWSLLCVTTGFYPPTVRLSWTQTLAGGRTEPIGPDCSWNTTKPKVRSSQNLTTLSWWLSDSNATLYPWQPLSQCLRLMDGSVRSKLLISVLELPSPETQSDDVIYTCLASGHPALSAALSASFTQKALPNMVIGYLNMLKIAVLSGLILALMVSAMGYMCIKKEQKNHR